MTNRMIHKTVQEATNKKSNKRRISVLGSGSWGTALAHHLTLAGHNVTIWGNDAEVLESIRIENKNIRYLNNITLASGIHTTLNLEEALRSDIEVLVISLPSAVVREVMRQCRPLVSASSSLLVISTTKGLEIQTKKFMTQVIEEELGSLVRPAVLSGPSFAREVAQGLPTAVTVASKNIEDAKEAARCFHFENFRTYTSKDVIGVQLGGVIKNVIAIACGVVDGVQMGANARAALLTRGLAEMLSIVQALGGEKMTVVGLSGLGDMLLTATCDLSRNRRVGLGLGRGERLEKIVEDLGQVAEGIVATRILLEMAREHNLSTPIIEEVAKLLEGNTTVLESAKALLSRETRPEC
jgi:glycerol-3-phosphate dehydrogenase (NAD(P)+)